MSVTANRVIKNTGYLYAKMGITMFISLYTTRLILNSLGASDFGIFNIVGGAIAMLGFLNSAMASATQRFMSYSEGEGNKEKQKSIFNISLVLHFAIAFIVGFALLIAGYFFFNGVLNIPGSRVFAAQMVYGSLIVSTMFTVMTVPYDAVMNTHENMKYYALVGILESVLKLAVAFACVYTVYDKLIVYGILMACIPLITLTVMRVYCHKHYVECVVAPRRYWDKGLMKEMTSFAGWNFTTSISNIATQYGLSIVLNHFWGAVLNAAQGIGNQLCGQLQALSNNMLKAVNPVIAKSEGAHQRDKMLNVALSSCKISYLIMLFCSLPFLLEMPFVMQLWLKEVPAWATLFCSLQIIRTLLDLIIYPLNVAVNAQGQIKSISICKSVLNLLPVFLTYICFRFGFAPYWMYITWIGCWNLLGGAITLYYSIKLCSLSLNSFLTTVLYPCLLQTIICLLTGFAIQHIWAIASFHRMVFVAMGIWMVFITFGWKYVLTVNEKRIVMGICSKLLKIKNEKTYLRKD